MAVVLAGLLGWLNISEVRTQGALIQYGKLQLWQSGSLVL
jgi:hypothetical protein